jgi:aminoglycoside phosphotransferase (APT) family kinase protein
LAEITDDGTEFTLLLEDLSPALPGDQLAGCSLEQAEAAVRNLAALHASRWNDASLLDYRFLAPGDRARADATAATFGSSVEEFLRRYESRLDDSDVNTLRRSAESLADWLVARPEPFTVVHGDHRLDNLMFHPDGWVAALDWQSVSASPPGRDLAYFIATTFESAERTAVEKQLVTAYHAELEDRGVAGYSYEQCFDDYRVGQLQGPMITVFGAVTATAAADQRADLMFLAMARRSCAAIRELETLSLVG